MSAKAIRSITRISAQAIAERTGAYFINQFANPDNPQGARRDDRRRRSGSRCRTRLDAIVIGVGSSGTHRRPRRVLQEDTRRTWSSCSRDPQGSILAEYIATGKMTQKGSWLVEGIGEDFIPADRRLLADASAPTAFRTPSRFPSRASLLQKEGVLAGSSTGTLLAAALRYCREQKTPKRVVTLACDTGARYLSKLYNDFWMEDQGFIQREKYGDLRDLIGRPHGERATITVGSERRAHDCAQSPAQRRLLAVAGDGRRQADRRRDRGRHPALRVRPSGDVSTSRCASAMTTTFLRVDKSHCRSTIWSRCSKCARPRR